MNKLIPILLLCLNILYLIHLIKLDESRNELIKTTCSYSHNNLTDYIYYVKNVCDSKSHKIITDFELYGSACVFNLSYCNNNFVYNNKQIFDNKFNSINNFILVLLTFITSCIWLIFFTKTLFGSWYKVRTS